MKHFFQVVFGGLFAVGTGVLVAYAGTYFWHIVRPHVQTSSTELQASFDTTDEQSSSIASTSQTVRYTSTEEEDVFNAASQSLPKGSDKRITSHSYLVQDISRDVTIAEYNPDTIQPIASITKLVTAVIARKYIPSDTHITITRNIMATYGNTAQFQVGETFTAHDMLYPLLMVSSNDAAEAYATSYGRIKFLQAMNDFVQLIGAYRTYFRDPSGLSPENVSTPHDLALILKWIVQHDPEIIDITTLKSKTLRSHTFVNVTHFLSWSYYAGGKNGYTTEANRTAAQLFRLGRDNDLYAVIALGSNIRDADMLNLLKKIEK